MSSDFPNLKIMAMWDVGRVVRWIGISVSGEPDSVKSESHPEDGGSRLHQNVGAYVACCTALRPHNVHCHQNIIWYLVQFRNSVGWL